MTIEMYDKAVRLQNKIGKFYEIVKRFDLPRANIEIEIILELVEEIDRYFEDSKFALYLLESIKTFLKNENEILLKEFENL